MDLRFIISDMNPLTHSRLPGGILNYLNDLEKLCVLQVFVLLGLTLCSLITSDMDVAQPVPPLHISHDNREYVLVTNASVRQSMEPPSFDPSSGIAITSESTLDLEIGHHSAVCVVRSSFVMHACFRSLIPALGQRFRQIIWIPHRSGMPSSKVVIR